MNYKSQKLLLTLSFIEGGTVMSCELIGAKLMAPYFGTSLYVWASVLGLTLGGLTLGYFIGGRLSNKYQGSYKLLFKVLIAASILFIIMPWSSRLIMNTLVELPLEIGTIISLLIYLVPPLAFMGMVSPLIINLLTLEASMAGNNAGKVYAISTLGGILFTFLMGFWVIPKFGLQSPAVVNGLLLSALPLYFMVKESKVNALAFILIGAGILLAADDSEIYNSPEYKLIYKSEGILGQVKVVDHPAYEFKTDGRMGRALLVNNTLQTYIGLDDDMRYSIWDWSQYFPSAASVYPPDSKVLLLGLGGGTLVKQLESLGFDVDVVEIDKRIRDVSVEYFNLDPLTNVVIDDARHYIKTCSETYDIIIYDTFLSESVPEHLLTIEGFKDARKILNENGMIMSNFYGFIEGNKGEAARSVLKTFLESDFSVEILATPGNENSRNLIFIGSDSLRDFSNLRYGEPKLDTLKNLYPYFIDKRFLDMANCESLSDYKPRLSKMYNPLAKSWKISYNNYYRKYFVE